MKEINKELPTGPTFESFETRVLDHVGLTGDEQTGIFNTLDEISAQIYEEDAKRPSFSQRYNLRKVLWENSDRNMRTALILGTIIRGGWKPQDRTPFLRDDLYFDAPEELTERIAVTNFVEQAAGHTEVINEEFMKSGFVPARMIEWNAALYENASPSQQKGIINSFRATHFGYFSPDSEAEEPFRHSVELVLNDNNFPKAFQPHVIELALREIEASEGYKELPAALGRTYRAMPEQFSFNAASRIRKIVGMTAIEGSHEETIARDRQEQAEAEKDFTEWWNGLMSSAIKPEKDFSQIIGSRLLKRAEELRTRE